MGEILVCPFCLTIFLNGEYNEEDDCPDCMTGQLIDYEEYKLRFSASFMDYIAKDRGAE